MIQFVIDIISCYNLGMSGIENLTRVKQAVIAAGGKGTRISPELNPNGSKVFIEHNGRTLFEYLVNSLVDGGVERIVVSTAYHTDRRIREIMWGKNVDSVVIPISEMGSFRWILIICKIF